MLLHAGERRHQDASHGRPPDAGTGRSAAKFHPRPRAGLCPLRRPTPVVDVCFLGGSKRQQEDRHILPWVVTTAAPSRHAQKHPPAPPSHLLGPRAKWRAPQPRPSRRHKAVAAPLMHVFIEVVLPFLASGRAEVVSQTVMPDHVRVTGLAESVLRMGPWLPDWRTSTSQHHRRRWSGRGLSVQA